MHTGSVSLNWQCKCKLMIYVIFIDTDFATVLTFAQHQHVLDNHWLDQDTCTKTKNKTKTSEPNIKTWDLIETLAQHKTITYLPEQQVSLINILVEYYEIHTKHNVAQFQISEAFLASESIAIKLNGKLTRKRGTKYAFDCVIIRFSTNNSKICHLWCNAHAQTRTQTRTNVLNNIRLKPSTTAI